MANRVLVPVGCKYSITRQPRTRGRAHRGDRAAGRAARRQPQGPAQQSREPRAEALDAASSGCSASRRSAEPGPGAGSQGSTASPDSRRAASPPSALAKAFAFGALIGVRTTRIPSLAKTSSKERENLASRSRIRNWHQRNHPPRRQAISRSAWVTRPLRAASADGHGWLPLTMALRNTPAPSMSRSNTAPTRASSRSSNLR